MRSTSFSEKTPNLNWCQYNGKTFSSRPRVEVRPRFDSWSLSLEDNRDYPNTTHTRDMSSHGTGGPRRNLCFEGLSSPKRTSIVFLITLMLLK